MKKSKKLMILGLSLATGAVAATSTVSSFAWFSMNTKVTADGLAVKATASKNLLISDESNGTYLPTVSLGTDVATLVPTSTATSSPANINFYKLTAVGTGMVATDEYAVYNTTFGTATANKDYIEKSVWIQSVGDKATDLVATVNVESGNSKKLDPALRLMLVASNKTYLYKVNEQSDTNYSAIKKLTTAEQKVNASSATLTADTDGKALSNVTYYDDAACTTKSTNIVAGTTVVTDKYVVIPAGAIETVANDGYEEVNTYSVSGTTAIIGTLAKDTPAEVKIYIWYEGQDSHCYATNAVDLDRTEFSLSFTVSA